MFELQARNDRMLSLSAWRGERLSRTYIAVHIGMPVEEVSDVTFRGPFQPFFFESV